MSLLVLCELPGISVVRLEFGKAHATFSDTQEILVSPDGKKQVFHDRMTPLNFVAEGYGTWKLNVVELKGGCLGLGWND